MRRHSNLHTRSASAFSNSPQKVPTFVRRTVRACAPCARAKVKCHDEKPCRRCQQRRLHCDPSSLLSTSPVESRDFAATTGDHQNSLSVISAIPSTNDIFHFQDDWNASDVAGINPSPGSHIYSQPAKQSNTGSLDQQFDRILQEYDQFQFDLAFSDTQMQTLNYSNQDAATSAQDDDFDIAVYADTELTQGFNNSTSTQSPEHSHRDIQASFWHSMSGNAAPHLATIYHPNTDDAHMVELLSTGDSSSWQYNFDQRTRDSLIMTLSQDSSY